MRPAYAVEKLTQATRTKRFKNANTYLIMGDAYRKLIDGGNAVTSYNKALEIEPNLAAAKNSIEIDPQNKVAGEVKTMLIKQSTTKNNDRTKRLRRLPNTQRLKYTLG